jgi:hypothetical protein
MAENHEKGGKSYLWQKVCRRWRVLWPIIVDVVRNNVPAMINQPTSILKRERGMQRIVNESRES